MHIVVTGLCRKRQKWTGHSQFFKPNKNGILKTDSVSAHKKKSKTEFSRLSVSMVVTFDVNLLSDLGKASGIGLKSYIL